MMPDAMRPLFWLLVLGALATAAFVGIAAGTLYAVLVML